jgi:hypothetical protein
MSSADLIQALEATIEQVKEHNYNGKTLTSVLRDALKYVNKTMKPKKGAAENTEASEKPKRTLSGAARKNNAWVGFVLEHAQKNGWGTYDKYSKKHEWYIDEPASTLHEGIHVFAGSVTDALPTGRKFVRKDAMTLSPKLKLSNPQLYSEFEAGYIEPTTDTVQQSESVSVIQESE